MMTTETYVISSFHSFRILPRGEPPFLTPDNGMYTLDISVILDVLRNSKGVCSKAQNHYNRSLGLDVCKHSHWVRLENLR